MREIKFRGKRVDDKEWVYGNLIIDEDRYYICLQVNEHIKRDDYEVYMIEVDPETIGQYTGLHDKNGKEIYEGDIVGDNSIKWVIKWCKHRMGFSLYPTTEQIYDEMPINVIEKLNFEVIGNTTDNPELLEGE